MSLMTEYIQRRLGGSALQAELSRLVAEYNKLRGTYLLVYAAAIGKPIPTIPIIQDDFYVIRDLLAGVSRGTKLDIYIETHGGSGETVEEIATFLHNKSDSVSFVVSGEAKSAGTLLVMSGDEILMTETASLGPIDAQMKIGRSVVSAYDYMEWVEEKRDEASKIGKLNPFDATMVAQITPGELRSVFHALEFAKDLVVEWLPKYKFKSWDVTEKRKATVTADMKRRRAEEIAEKLAKHSLWRLHGRSLKISDLTDTIGLRITRVDDDRTLSDIVYRIQTICRLLFESSTIYKVFVTQDGAIYRQAAPTGLPVKPPKMKAADVVEIGQRCTKCGKEHKIYAKFTPDPRIDADFTKKGLTPFPKDAKIVCECGFEIDLSGLKNQIEVQLGKPIVA